MGDFVVSSKRYNCPLCKVWVPDNARSRRLHEESGSHKKSMQNEVRKAVKAQKQQQKDETQAANELKRVEKEAEQASQCDLKLFESTNLHPLAFKPVVPHSSGSSSFQTVHHGWFAHRSVDGSLFYKNEKTGQTQKTRPAELGPDRSIAVTTQTISEPPRPIISRAPPKPKCDEIFLKKEEWAVDPNTGLGVWQETEDLEISQPSLTQEPPPQSEQTKRFLSFSLKPQKKLKEN